MFPASKRPLIMHAAMRLLATCVMALAVSAPVWAQMGRDQAAATAERQTGGRVLAVERVESGNGPLWRVKVVTPRGEVRVVLIEADGGRGPRADGRRDGAQEADTGRGQEPARGGSQRSHRPGRGG